MAPDDERGHEPQQIALMRRLVEMSAECNYQNAERTLAVWIRTALSLMIFGIAIDRFGLLLREQPDLAPRALDSSHATSSWCGEALVVLGIAMALTTGARFVAYATDWRRHHTMPAHHGPYLAPSYAMLVALFGIALLVILLTATR